MRSFSHPLALTAFLLLFFQANGSSKTLDTCFSPVGHCDQVLMSWINSSVKTLDAAIYGLTDPDIAAAFIAARDRGVKIRLVQDRSQSKGVRNVGTTLQRAGIPVHVQAGSRGGIQHNKFLVIDGKFVLTGSFNWTYNASHKNDENFVVLDDEAAAFEKEFDRLWNYSEPFKGSMHRRRRSTASYDVRF